MGGRLDLLYYSLKVTAGGGLYDYSVKSYVLDQVSFFSFVKQELPSPLVRERIKWHCMR